MRNIVETILRTDSGSDETTILRWMKKANVIIFTDGIYLICDDKYIYYFGAILSSRGKSKLGKFVKQYTELCQGKQFYSKDVTNFSKRARLLDKKIGLYQCC